MNVEETDEIPNLDGSVGFEDGVQYAGDIPDEMFESQIAEGVQAESDSEIAQPAELQYSTFV